MDRDREFGEYYASRAHRMRAAAYLMCGDWHRAEDVVQNAFIKLYLGWHRIRADTPPDQYLRQVIATTMIDDGRRPWRRERATPDETIPDRSVTDPVPEDRMVLLQALAQLPARQRVTLVLRYFEDLSTGETAEMLGIAVGTVKSQTARGLEGLRSVLGESFHPLSTVD